MSISTRKKQPWEVKDFPIDYSGWLEETNDTLASVDSTSIVCTTDALNTALVVDSTTVNSPTVIVRISGGTNLHNYKVTVRAVTTSGQQVEFEFIVTARDK